MSQFFIDFLDKRVLNHLVALSALVMLCIVSVAPLVGETPHSLFLQEGESGGQLAMQGTFSSSSSSAGRAHALLGETVARFWTALMSGDGQLAVSFVESGNEQLLTRLYAFPVAEWKVDEIEWIDDTTAQVTVDALFKMPPGFTALPIRVEQQWQEVEGNWLLNLQLSGESNPLEILYGNRRKNNGREGFEVRPSVVVMHFLNAPQRGVLHLANGKNPVEIARIEMDEESFRLVDSVRELKANETGKIVLEYKGTSLSKDQESQITLHIRLNGEEASYEIPVLYNYISPSLKAFFGLNSEEIEKLKPGAVLEPSIN